MPAHETLTLNGEGEALEQVSRWWQVQQILDEFHTEMDAQISQHGAHPFINDLPDERDALIQLGARVVQAIRMHDQERAGAE